MEATVCHRLTASKLNHCPGLQPLLGSHNIILNPALDQLRRPSYPGDMLTNKPRDQFTSRVCSFKVEATDSSADIDFLRDKVGLCLPTEEQVLHEEKLKLTKRVPHEVERSQFYRSVAAARTESERPTEPETSTAVVDTKDEIDKRDQQTLDMDKLQKRNIEDRKFKESIAFIQQKRLKLHTEIARLPGRGRDDDRTPLDVTVTTGPAWPLWRKATGRGNELDRIYKFIKETHYL